MSCALITSKRCSCCGEEKPLSAFYRNPKQLAPYCIPCHKTLCAARVKASPARRAQQYQAKQRWTARNPEAKRIHEGRAIFLGRVSAPTILCNLERAIMRLGSREVTA